MLALLALVPAAAAQGPAFTISHPNPHICADLDTVTFTITTPMAFVSYVEWEPDISHVSLDGLRNWVLKRQSWMKFSPVLILLPCILR